MPRSVSSSVSISRSAAEAQLSFPGCPMLLGIVAPHSLQATPQAMDTENAWLGAARLLCVVSATCPQ